MVELVDDAIRLLTRQRGISAYTGRVSDAAAEAKRWIARGDIGWISFNSCCAWLGLDASSVRRAVLDG